MSVKNPTRTKYTMNPTLKEELDANPNDIEVFKYVYEKENSILGETNEYLRNKMEELKARIAELENALDTRIGTVL